MLPHVRMQIGEQLRPHFDPFGMSGVLVFELFQNPIGIELRCLGHILDVWTGRWCNQDPSECWNAFRYGRQVIELGRFTIGIGETYGQKSRSSIESRSSSYP